MHKRCSSHTVWRSLLVVELVLISVGAQAQPSQTLSCPNEAVVPGLVQLLKPGNVVLLGEMHGTNESPVFLTHAVCVALQRGHSVTVGLELPHTEIPLLEEYLASSGGDDAEKRLVQGPFWQRSYQDGRTSQAMLTLIQAMHAYQEMDLPVRVILIDDPAVPKRDRVMSTLVQAAVSVSPKDVFLVLTGNVHNRITQGTRWDASYEPMGYLLRQSFSDKRLVSLNVAHQGGEAWVCLSNEPCGVQQLGGKADRGSGVALFADSARGAYDGQYYVGHLTASLPAIQSREPTECEAEFETQQSSLSLAYDAFDQTPDQGWRSLAGKACYREASDLIGSYLGTQTALTQGEKRNLSFHAGQLLAFADDYSAAIPYFEQARREDEPEDASFKWNAYVNATIAFLRRDRVALEAYRSEVARGAERNGSVPNLLVVDGLLRNLDKPYKDAYGSR